MPRPRSESFYVTLAPEMTKLLSLSSKASISRSPSPPSSPTDRLLASSRSTTTTIGPLAHSLCGGHPALRARRMPAPVATTPMTSAAPPSTPTTVVLPLRRRSSHNQLSDRATHARKISSDADDESESPKPMPLSSSSVANQNRIQRDASVAELSSLFDDFTFPSPPPAPVNVYPWSPRKPSSLRRNTLTIKPVAPSAMYTASLVNARFGPEQPLRRRPRPALYTRVLRTKFLHSPEGSNARRFGLRTAWRVDEEVRGALRLRNVQWLEHDDDVEVHQHDEDPYIVAIRPLSPKAPVNPAREPPSSLLFCPVSSSSEDSSSGSDGVEEHSEFSDSDSDSDYDDEDEEGENKTGATWEIISL